MSFHILLIEDDVMSQDVIRALCESRGYEVDVASDGFEGLKLLRATSYGAVLVDYHLPAMDGYALARLIRDIASESGAAPKLIGITADQNGLAARRGADTLFDAMLSKPLTPNSLFGTIERLCADLHVAIPDGRDELASDRARMAAETIWRRRGAFEMPKAFAVPSPSADEAEAIRHCFHLVDEPAAADLLLLLGPAGLSDLPRLQADPGGALPVVDVSGVCSDHADVVFEVDHQPSWTAVAAKVSASRFRRERLAKAVGTAVTSTSLPGSVGDGATSDQDALVGHAKTLNRLVLENLVVLLRDAGTSDEVTDLTVPAGGTSLEIDRLAPRVA